MSPNFLKSVSGVIQGSSRLLYRLDRKTLKIDEHPVSKLRYILSKIFGEMNKTEEPESWVLTPPDAVKGMTQLNREAFHKSVKIPGLKVPKKEIGSSQKSWRPLFLKLPGLKPVAELSDKDPLRDSHSLILMDPQKLTEESLQPHQVEMLQRLGLDLEKPDNFEVELKYDNWSVADVLRAVLPTEVDNVTSYTQVGHIAHLNLKPETLPFKNLIGQVIMDKVPSVKTVVNKLNTIDNTYRNFSMELLAGEDNFITQTKEHNCVFELDFSKVYWNSRLATEHDRIVGLIPKGSVVYDVFAGIGPFAIPLAKKKKCSVFANDLNPASYESLQKNIKLNNIKQGTVTASNLDGREFISTVVKDSLVKILEQSSLVTKACDSSSPDNVARVESQDTSSNDNVDSGTQKPDVSQSENGTPNTDSYVIMNLPAIAVEFLSAFRAILHDVTPSPALKSSEPQEMSRLLPHVYCYAFSPKGEIDTELKKRVAESLGCPVPSDYSTRLVRNVAPNKEMVCISFRLWPELVLASRESSLSHTESRKRESDQDEDEAHSKKQRVTAD